MVMKDDFLSACMAHSHRVRADGSKHDYNFVISHALAIKLDAVVKPEKNKRPPLNYVSNKAPGDVHEEIVASLAEGPASSTVVQSVYYRSSTIYAESASNGVPIWIGFNRAMWMTYWEYRICSMKKLVRLSSHLNRPVTNTYNWQLKPSFDSIFSLGSGEGTVKLGNLVGMLSRNRMLSDTIIDFRVRCICNWVEDSYAMGLFAPTFGSPRSPTTRISRCHFVALPLHPNAINWGVVMVRIAYHLEQPRLTPYFYEPLWSNAYRKKTERSVEANRVWIDGPKQPDGTSCGVLCIVHVYDMLNDYSRLARGAVTEEDVAIMSLCIMWMILMQPYLTT
ncbi:hypothetical protein PHMEG_0009737 [Phytophthora megakarya]|uniref:Ubiquitin-like protease family profile domain-containing protein n=1 Tax=Phytophthora megakarya TaxID=4795 RepID=A0A225WHI3_9STRA|nr:hypothetical protein PHMEG_0009737 [Phytophthora megakarya]